MCLGKLQLSRKTPQTRIGRKNRKTAVVKENWRHTEEYVNGKLLDGPEQKDQNRERKKCVKENSLDQNREKNRKNAVVKEICRQKGRQIKLQSKQKREKNCYCQNESARQEKVWKSVVFRKICCSQNVSGPRPEQGEKKLLGKFLLSRPGKEKQKKGDKCQWKTKNKETKCVHIFFTKTVDKKGKLSIKKKNCRQKSKTVDKKGNKKAAVKARQWGENKMLANSSCETQNYKSAPKLVVDGYYINMVNDDGYYIKMVDGYVCFRLSLPD